MQIVIVGAGGSGISNLAHIIRDLGYTNIIGIDACESQMTDALEKKGIPIKIGHGKYEVKDDDVVIYSETAKNSPEVQHAISLKKEKGLPMKVWNYFEFLGELSKYFRTVGIAGTNGKSSSTALAIVVGKKLIPNLGIGIVGALVPDLENKGYYLSQEKLSEFRQLFDFIFTGKNLPYHLIKKYYFFLEACEYKRHFLHLDLEHLLITNMELDHTDYYKDWDDYRLAFFQMNQNTRKETLVLENNENNTVITDYSGFKNLKYIPITHHNLEYVWGKHTDCNASLVEGLFKTLDPKLTSQIIQETMEPFKGIWRRLEYLGLTESGAKIYTDYGHIASSLSLGYYSLRERFPNKKIIGIFQPHQIRRVLAGWDNFKDALSLFDGRIIYSIYAARESLEDFKDDPIFQKKDFQSLQEFGNYFAHDMNAKYFGDFKDLKHEISKLFDENYVIAIFTAGDLDYKIRQSDIISTY